MATKSNVYNPLKANNVIAGTFGRVLLNDIWMTNFTGLEAKEENDWTEVKLVGSRRSKHKLTSIKGSGTITGFKISSDLQSYLLANPDQEFKIISYLGDPEALGTEEVIFNSVKFSTNELANWKAGELVQESWPFVYDEEPEFQETIESNDTSGSTTAPKIPTTLPPNNTDTLPEPK